MTQTPVSPAQGIAAVPVTVTSGVTSTIPFPTLPNGGPVPWRTPWVVVLNSSPFTLLVTSGAQTTQIASFTSDKVYVTSQGVAMPVTVTPLVGAAVPLTGQDSTVYATWYADDPGNTYPAALGAGAANLASATVLVPQTGITNINNGTGVTLAFQQDIGVFLGMSMFGQISAGGPVMLVASWQDAAGTSDLAFRKMLIGANGVGANNVRVAMPHLGPKVSVFLRNDSGGAANYFVAASHLRIPRDGFTMNGTTTGAGDVGGDQYMPITSTATVAGATSTFNMNLDLYAGPVTLYLDLVGMQNFVVVLQRQNSSGVWLTATSWRQGMLPNNGVAIPIVVPAVPVRVQITNNDLVSRTPTVVAYADDWRNP